MHVKVGKRLNSKMPQNVELEKEPMQFTNNKEYFFIAWILKTCFEELQSLYYALSKFKVTSFYQTTFKLLLCFNSMQWTLKNGETHQFLL